MPMDAPVMTTTLSFNRMPSSYRLRANASSKSVQSVEMSDLIPLFPLELVLFPETPFPLHIFEPRYKEMVSECLKNKTTFGIVRTIAEDDSVRLADYGCT